MAWERWIPEDWERAKELLATQSLAVVALMVRRPVASLKEKIRWESMPEEKRAARREQINARRRCAAKGKQSLPRLYTEVVTRGPEISEAMKAERDQRWSTAPRNMTAAFCGDPLPGYSALERRT